MRETRGGASVRLGGLADHPVRPLPDADFVWLWKHSRKKEKPYIKNIPMTNDQKFSQTAGKAAIAAACWMFCWIVSFAGEKPSANWPLYDGKESIADYAKRTGLKPTQTLGFGSGVKMEFVLVPAGSFVMGGPGKRTWDGQGNEGPVHQVTITKPFYIGKYEVTVAQFAAFVSATKHQTEAEKAGNKGNGVKEGRWGPQKSVNWRNPGIEQTPDHPVVLVSWNDAQAFALWLTEQTGQNVRLPTEAQWEFAARGPKSMEYPFGEKWDARKVNHRDVALKNAGWKHGGASNDNDGYAYTAPVGVFNNASWCGAFDMAGNVWEWVKDWEADYPAEAQLDPQGPASGQRRVTRGGSWVDIPRTCRAASRERMPPNERTMTNGIRVTAAVSALSAGKRLP